MDHTPGAGNWITDLQWLLSEVYELILTDWWLNFCWHFTTFWCVISEKKRKMPIRIRKHWYFDRRVRYRLVDSVEDASKQARKERLRLLAEQLSRRRQSVTRTNNTRVFCVYDMAVGSVERRCVTPTGRSATAADAATSQLFGSGYIASPNYPARLLAFLTGRNSRRFGRGGRFKGICRQWRQLGEDLGVGRPPPPKESDGESIIHLTFIRMMWDVYLKYSKCRPTVYCRQLCTGISWGWKMVAGTVARRVDPQGFAEMTPLYMQNCETGTVFHPEHSFRTYIIGFQKHV